MSAGIWCCLRRTTAARCLSHTETQSGRGRAAGRCASRAGVLAAAPERPKLELPTDFPRPRSRSRAGHDACRRSSVRNPASCGGTGDAVHGPAVRNVLLSAYLTEDTSAFRSQAAAQQRHPSARLSTRSCTGTTERDPHSASCCSAYARRPCPSARIRRRSILVKELEPEWDTSWPVLPGAVQRSEHPTGAVELTA